jgi:hypothetical protein
LGKTAGAQAKPSTCELGQHTGNRTEGSNPSLSAENLMQTKLDHVVLWVTDPIRTLDFFVNVVGLTGGAGSVLLPRL